MGSMVAESHLLSGSRARGARLAKGLLARILVTLLQCSLCRATSRGHQHPVPHAAHAKPGIPHIIHQSWKNTEVPERFKKWPESWKQLHPHWEYRLWTDEDNMALVTDKFAWFLDTYIRLRDNIMRADAARYMYMYEYGGMYADLDFEALRNMDKLLEGHSAVVAAMGSDVHVRETIPNAWMASTPRHQFWLFCLQQIIKRGTEDEREPIFSAEDITGPYMLHHSVQLYQAWRKGIHDAGGPPSDLTVLPLGVVYPIDWRHQHKDWPFPEREKGLPMACWVEKGTFNDTECKKRFPDAYAITYWTHSWTAT